MTHSRVYGDPMPNRKRATTPLGRSILQKQRKKLVEEQALLGEQEVEAARRRMQMKEKVPQADLPDHLAINRGLVHRIGAVLASEGVNVPIMAHSSYSYFKAWTDFSQINVTYRIHPDARLTAAILRGMLYHEGGHVRFTIPFPTLEAMAREEYRWTCLPGDDITLPLHPDGTRKMQFAWNALEDQRMESAVVADSPRKAIYFTPMVIGELMKDVNSAKENWPLLIWRKYLPKHLRDKARSYWITQHGVDAALEVESTVNKYVTGESALDLWIAVIEMTEHFNKTGSPAFVDFGHDDHMRTWRLPESAKDANVNSNKLQIPIDPSSLDEDTLKDLLDSLDTPPDTEESDTETEAIDETADEGALPDEPEVEHVLPVATPGGKSSGTGQPSGNRSDGTKRAPTGGSEDGEGDDEDDFESAYTNDDSFGNTPAEEGSIDATPHDTDSSSQAGSNGAHNETYEEALAPPSDEKFAEDLEAAQEEAESERYEDKALDGDVQAFQEAKWNNDSLLLPYNPGVETDEVVIAEADTLAYEIEQAFEASTVDRAPAWVEQQRRGVVNVLRYQTRQVGDTEFYRAWVDDEQPGYDISVSILLDYSGSMDRQMTALGQIAYAIKAACDRLNIPCTVVLWDTEARTLFDAKEQVHDVPKMTAAGGTDPTEALEDLENQRADKAKHIVLIFTDGEWYGIWETRGGETPHQSILNYKEEGRYFIGFTMGCDSRSLLSRGCDESYEITDLMDIPRRLESALIEHA